MGVTVRELLLDSRFKDYRVIAGAGGLDKQIQGVGVFDAPDAFKWTRGKEFAITSGYMLTKETDYLKRMTSDKNFRSCSCMGLKLRWVKSIDDSIKQKFDEIEIPLIIIPENVSWMDIINDVNNFVMNKNIKKMNLESSVLDNISDVSYQNHKIQKVLRCFEEELNLPSILYDLESDTKYLSSSYSVKRFEDKCVDEYLNPSDKVDCEVLCDNIDMIRYREVSSPDSILSTWITIPIKVFSKIKSYLILIEDEHLSDYFDQYSIRLGFFIIQNLFEQIFILNSAEERLLERFMRRVLQGNISDQELIAMSKEVNLNAFEKYYMMLIKLKTSDFNFKEKDQFYRDMSLSRIIEKKKLKLIVLNNAEILIIVPSSKILYREFQELISNMLNGQYSKKINKNFVKIGYIADPICIEQFEQCYKKCCKSILIGEILWPNKDLILYEDLGILGLMDLNYEVLKSSKQNLINKLDVEDAEQLLQTLKVYLHKNRNYSQTAREMYLHINTVRKRIEFINEQLELDLDDPIERLKIEMLLNMTL